MMGAIVRSVDLLSRKPDFAVASKTLRWEGVVVHEPNDDVCLDTGSARFCLKRALWHRWDCDPAPGTTMAITFGFGGGFVWLERLETMR
jgi:hypothetical protein